MRKDSVKTLNANRRLICGLSSALLIAGLVAVFGADDPSDATKSLTVLQYLGARASRMEKTLPPVPDNLTAWHRRRAQVRQDLAALLGLRPREPMRAKVLASCTDGDVIVEDVIYLWAERCYVPGIVVRASKAIGRLPALVVPPEFGGASKGLDGLSVDSRGGRSRAYRCGGIVSGVVGALSPSIGPASRWTARL